MDERGCFVCYYFKSILILFYYQINSAIIKRLNKIEGLFDKIQIPVEVIEQKQGNDESSPDSGNKLHELCLNVWPALVVMAGYDRGLRVGGYAKHKCTGRRAIVLGILKKGITTVSVQWESDGSVADVPIANLEYIEAPPFNNSKFNGKIIYL